MVAVKRNATYADLLALPDNVIGQIVDGELYAAAIELAPTGCARSSRRRRHASIAARSCASVRVSVSNTTASGP